MIKKLFYVRNGINDLTSTDKLLFTKLFFLKNINFTCNNDINYAYNLCQVFLKIKIFLIY